MHIFLGEIKSKNMYRSFNPIANHELFLYPHCGDAYLTNKELHTFHDRVSDFDEVYRAAAR